MPLTTIAGPGQADGSAVRAAVNQRHEIGIGEPHAAESPEIALGGFAAGIRASMAGSARNQRFGFGMQRVIPIVPRRHRGADDLLLDKIGASGRALRRNLKDVVRTRIYLKHADDCKAASHAHGRVFDTIRPSNTLVEVGNLVGEYVVEIEAEAVVEAG